MRTASGGTASNRLGDLFSKQTGTWSFTPTITLPIFTGGRNRANLDLAHIEKNIAVAHYELAIQTAFREVSDALNARGTYRAQRWSQESLVAADADVYSLAEVRFRSGLDSYLTTLDAQRSLYAAQQQLVVLRQAELANPVTLYKALGGASIPSQVDEIAALHRSDLASATHAARLPRFHAGAQFGLLAQRRILFGEISGCNRRGITCSLG